MKSALPGQSFDNGQLSALKSALDLYAGTGFLALQTASAEGTMAAAITAANPLSTFSRTRSRE
jgi:hypothetical protein